MILRALAVLALLLCAEGQPTGQPSRQPSSRPSTQPSSQPTGQPSRQPTGQPSMQPTTQPTGQPTTQPTSKPSLQPSRQPTGQPSRQPTGQPSAQPSAQPTGQPTMQPSLQPTSRPTMQPTQQPTSRPSNQPSGQPSRQPFGRPTGQPSRQPTQEPTNPSGQPTRQPSGQPSRQPTMRPSRQPTNRPSGQPSSAPSAGKSLIVTQVAQQFTGMSTQTYCSSFGCGAACSNAQEAFSDTIRRTVLFVLKLSSVRHVLWVDGPKCRRRLLLSETEGAGQYSNPNLRRLDSSSDSITVTFEVQTADPAVNPSTITATITSAVNSGYYTSLLRTFAVANKLNSLESFSAGMVLSAVATKTSSPVIIPTFSPTEQTALMWLKKWYIPWSVACAVLGTCIIVTAVALIRRRQHMMQEEMLDLENRKKAADELLARRFAPGVTAANAPHILKMRDNFKRAYGRDPSSKSPYDETKSSADLETFMASPHDDSSLGHGRAGSPSSPTGGSGASAAWLKHASSASSSGSKGRYPAMNKTPQKHSLTRAATSTVPTPRVKTVLTLGGSPGPGEADQSPSRTPGDRPDVTNLTGDALRKLVVSERSLNRDYRYTLMLPERETTARMNDLLQSPAKPTAKEASVLQRYVSDLMAENDKMLKQLEKMRLTGTYTGTSASGAGAGSRVMLTGGSGGGGYAPTGSVNKDALKRSQTSPRGREGDSPSPGGAGGSGAYSPRARNSS